MTIWGCQADSASSSTIDLSVASRCYQLMILSFRCADTQALANGARVKRFLSMESVARRKLRQLQIARQLHDLRVPPGNRLEALKGERAGQHSIRVNDQYRVCFRWTVAGALDVEIVDIIDGDGHAKTQTRDARRAST